MKILKNLMLMLFLSVATLSNAQNTSYSLLADNTTEESYDLSMYVPEAKEELTLSNMTYSSNMLPTRNSNRGGELAVGLLVAGAAFLIGGLATAPPYQGYNGPNEPFFQQGPRMVAIMGGGAMLMGGLIVTLAR